MCRSQSGAREGLVPSDRAAGQEVRRQATSTTPRPGRDSVSYWRLIGASVQRDDRIPARLGAEGAADPEDPHCRRRELAGVRDGGGGSELEGE